MTVTKAIPKGSLVLVTGVNGFVASHVADQLLEHGYGVRGTARDESKLNLALDVLRKRHPGSTVEGVVVEDMTTDGAYDEAIAGVSGVAHVASDVSFGPDPKVVVGAAVAGVLNALKAAAKTPSVKRVVYTSSSIATAHPKPDTVFHVDASSWNEEDINLARADADRNIENWVFHVYGASKAESERAGWKFVKENNPGFVFNAVHPNMVLGPILYGKGSTAGWVNAVHKGDEATASTLKSLPPQYMVHARDVALIHLAALLEPDVENERLLAFAEPYNYGSLVDTFKKLDPSKEFAEVPAGPRDLSIVDTRRGTELLQRYGRAGFDGLEATLRDQVAHA